MAIVVFSIKNNFVKHRGHHCLFSPCGVRYTLGQNRYHVHIMHNLICTNWNIWTIWELRSTSKMRLLLLLESDFVEEAHGVLLRPE